MVLAEFKRSPRIALVIFLALAVSLPIAFLSLAKVLIFLAALAYLLKELLLRRPPVHLLRLSTGYVILIAMLLWGASLLWTGAGLEDALVAFVKHGKLVTIPILIYLVRSQREAKWGVAALLAGQTWVLFSSWLMAFDVPLPWVMRVSGPADPLTQFVPYADSYLDQSIMLASTAGVLWHLGRGHASLGKWSKCLALAGLFNVLVLMPGRTGYILAIVTVCLAALFEIPAKLRLVSSVVIPALLVLALFYTLPQFQQRVGQAAHELGTYNTSPDVHSSVGARLNMWKLSLQAIAERPWTGHGVGSWSPVAKRLYGTGGNALFGAGNVSNPHQELLLWTVELGIAGTLLFLGLLYALVSDTRALPTPVRRAIRSLMVMLLIACLFNSPLYDDLMGDYFCIALGLLLALGLRDNQVKPPAHCRPQVTD